MAKRRFRIEGGRYGGELVLGEVEAKDVMPDQRMEIGKHDQKIPNNILNKLETFL